MKVTAALFVEAAITSLVLRGERFWLTMLQDATARRQLEREVLEVSNREQQRIGNDLHDGLGQELTGIALLLRGLENRAEREAPALSPSIEEVALLVNDAIFTTRALARGLSPVTFDRGGLALALEELPAGFPPCSTSTCAAKRTTRSIAAWNPSTRCTCTGSRRKR